MAKTAKNKKERKKVVIFLVEGQSEVIALSNEIEKFCNKYYDNVITRLVLMDEDGKQGGDFTSKKGINPDCLEKCIHKLFIRKLAANYGLYEKDLAEIVQIVDLDGTFIPDDRVLCDESLAEKKENIYKDDRIVTYNADNIRERNHRKAANIKKMLTMKCVDIKAKSIPYSVYYFSSNLDHFLYGEANLEQEEKCNRAREFAEYCYDNPDNFNKTFTNTALTASPSMSYEESWEETFQGTNSLNRHTNLNLFFESKKNAKETDAPETPVED